MFSNIPCLSSLNFQIFFHSIIHVCSGDSDETKKSLALSMRDERKVFYYSMEKPIIIRIQQINGNKFETNTQIKDSIDHQNTCKLN